MAPVYDNHVHLRPHTKPPLPHNLEELAAVAHERGIVPGIREHTPLPKAYCLGEFEDFEYAMMLHEVDRFISLFGNSGISIGFEADYLRGYMEETEVILNGLLDAAREKGIPVSGINGSVHLLPGEINDLGVDKGEVGDIIWDLDESIFKAHISQRGAAGMVDDYFTRMIELVRTGLFDTLSHLELIRKFDAPGPDGKSAYFGEIEDMYHDRAVEVLEEVARRGGMTVELNMAGINNRLGRPYLSQRLLEVCASIGVPVSIGSDTHLPEGLGAHFEIGYDMCRRAGIKQLAAFRDRKMFFYDYE